MRKILPRSLRYLVISFLAISAILAAGAQTNCPTDIPDNSSLNENGKPSSWAPNAKITVWIDTSQITNGSPLYQGIVQSLSAWSSFLRTTGGYITILAGSGVPASGVLPQPWQVITVGDAGNKEADTDWKQDLSSGTVLQSTTKFDYSYQDANNAGTLTQAQAAGLEGHEMAQPFGLGDCTLADCVNSISEDDGNTLPGPSACDQSRIAQIRTAITAAYSSAPGSGAGKGSGNGPATCTGDPPNDTCVCTAGGSYSCDCDGDPTTCSDGTSAICYGGAWTCGTVTTSQCDGSAPCEGAICQDGAWDQTNCSNSCDDPCSSTSCSGYDYCSCNPTDTSCSGSGCSDVCDTDCSDYNYCSCYPNDPSCGGTTEPCNDTCDPQCENYDPYSCGACDCDYSCDEAIPVGSTPSLKVHPMCKNEGPPSMPQRPSEPVVARLIEPTGGKYAAKL